MSAPKFPTSDQAAVQRVRGVLARLADSQRQIERLLDGAGALPWGFIEQLDRAADIADEAAGYAMRLAVPKVQP
jgi:hypothetical protein